MSRAESVHPRLRGELLNGAPLSQDQGGSSPLTRGTQKTAAEGCRNKRFIPAYAGNSEGRISRARPFAVHPRLRGELRFSPSKCGSGCGSSPLTRGTPGKLRSTDPQTRFIPAYAGNSFSSEIRWSSETVHPRLRGELRLVK